MEVVLKLNARLQPMHRHELEDAIQGVLEKEQMGEVTGGGTVQNPDGEIVSCDIDIHLAGDKWDHVSFLVNLLNRLGIPNGSALLGIDRKFRVEVGTLEGLAYYLNNTDLPDVVYETCDINHVVEQMELAMKGSSGSPLTMSFQSPSSSEVSGSAMRFMMVRRSRSRTSGSNDSAARPGDCVLFF